MTEGGKLVNSRLASEGSCGAAMWSTPAVPGIVDPGSGHVLLSPSLSEVLGDVIARGVRQAIDAPTSVDNDIKLATQGEQWRGAPTPRDSRLC